MDDDPKRVSTRIQMLATLVATATYAAGFNPPGGLWQDIHDAAGHLPGDPIMRSTSHLRYAVFFYCNAIAFTLSLIVVVVTLFVNTAHLKGSQHAQRKKEIHRYLVVLMAAVMVAFTVAYGAGACRTKLTIVWYSVQVPFPFFFVMYQASVHRPQQGTGAAAGAPAPAPTLAPAPAPAPTLAPAPAPAHPVVTGGSSSTETDKEGEVGAAAAAAEEKTTTKPDEEEEYFRALHSFSVMVPLSMFALTITYVAGLSTPGGFWDSAEGGHRPGQAVLGDRLQGKILRGFLTSNTTAFLASLYALSLLIAVQLKKPQETGEPRLRELFSPQLFRLMALFYLLLGLLAAYIYGNSRGRVNWPLYGEVLACMVVYLVVHVCVMKTAAHYKVPERAAKVYSRLAGKVRSTLAAAGKECSRLAGEVSRILMQIMCGCAAGSKDQPDPTVPENNQVATGQQGRNDPAATDTEKQKILQKNAEARRRRQASLVQLMAGLAVAITYQAGLYPPGGLWPVNADGHTAGDPILLTTNARRYKGFYYCNSVSFVASLLAMFLAQQKKSFLHDHHALEAAMLLDMLGLAGAYAIGSCRDQVSTLYVAGLAGAGVVYVFVHVSYFTLGDKDDNGAGGEEEDGVENLGGRFLLFAVLVASMTYQAGLTPPGGFLLKDDVISGHHASDPVLLYNYPRRYRAFFYCNSVSFMLSIVLILLLVNRNEYRPAIRSHALTVCSAVSYVCLMGAFAAGGTQHLTGSYFIFVLAGLPSLASVILFFRYWDNRRMNRQEKKEEEKTKKEEEEEKRTSKSVYLVTLGILVASATYSAGLDPPGGSWQSSSDGHDAGNPVMHDTRRHRYLAFFVGNTASFLASVMLVLVLLFAMHEKTPQNRHEETPQGQETPQDRHEETPQDRHEETPQGQETPQHKEARRHEETRRQYRKWVNGGLVSLQCLGFLVAYAAGSSRQWKTSAHIGTLVSAVLLFVAIHVCLSIWQKQEEENNQLGQGPGGGGQTDQV